MNKLRIIALIVCAIIFWAEKCFASDLKPKKPNIVLILADDMGWGDVPSNGNMEIETPVLDRLAEKSMSYDQFYVCQLCAPTRVESVERTWDWMPIGTISVKKGEENLALKLINKKSLEAGLIKAIRLVKF